MKYEPRLARRGLQSARKITRVGSRSFYFASTALDGPRRDAAYALYAFFRSADDAADDAGAADERLLRIGRARESLRRVYAGRPRSESEHALSWAVRTFGIPKEPISDLLAAVASDVGRVRIQTWTELDRYCHGVASTVGLAMMPLLGAPDSAAEAAAALGHAMQLTNILRDVKEDLALDRVYLPADALNLHGLTIADLERGPRADAWRPLARELGERAHELYERSESGVRAIVPKRSQWTVRLMRANYREILREIERRDYDVFRERIATSSARKIALASQLVLGHDAGLRWAA